MPMKHPPHPGRLLRADIDELGLSIAEAANALGVTRQHLYKVVKGESAITSDLAVRLEQAIGSSAEAWVRLQSAYDLANARERLRDIDLHRLVPKTA